ncbi:tellurite resistance TerB family protein [Pseudozobellia thermophila]|uniref:Uncharacterized conserved protein, tellurite resistance protein B (TerB) family n=1 Tax=Pseudozobellia thermophila TaxID=192903 RepID=A0A1M6CQ46_9FLAO|nr:TerB family tellurite resistance protein [Pseudozobellia thermophila]SHI62914.1 Uncharacterized conserved protein, tellurite resistance protein B (TerB) family [Pseudozobellia thermophila]
MEFEEVEKRAIVTMSYEVILADGTVHPDEVKALHRLREELCIDDHIVKEAQTISADEALIPLHNMSFEKKKKLGQILDTIAQSDKHLHEKEMDLIIQTFKNIGIGSESE